MTRRKSFVDVKSILAGYEPLEGMSAPAIIAHLTHTMAGRMPKQPIPWNWVAKIVNNRPKLPPEDGKEVKLVKGRLARAREICMDEYDRYIVHSLGFGIWATTNDDDKVRYGGIKANSRLASAGRRALEIRGITDSEKIKDPSLRDYFDRTNKALGVFESKVLPELKPKSDDDDDSGSKNK